ncbi:hypothetical protein CHARACLAT_026548, partial [Characodon lateralis]|nr:hypothetical protein [Characodon lateralis]
SAHTFQNPVDYYRKIYVEVLDLFDGELERRFEQRDLHVPAALEHMIISAAKKQTPSFPSLIMDLYKSDFDSDTLRAQLGMLRDVIQTPGIERGPTIASVASAMNATPVAKKSTPRGAQTVKIILHHPCAHCQF